MNKLIKAALIIIFICSFSTVSFAKATNQEKKRLFLINNTGKYYVGMEETSDPKRAKCYWGIVDIDGKVVIKPEYVCVQRFLGNNDLFEVEDKNGKWGLVDHEGKIVLDVKYDMINTYNKDFSMVLLDNNKGLIDNSGKVILDSIYYSIGKINKYNVTEIVMEQKNNGYDEQRRGLINEKGEILIEPKFYALEVLYQNLLRVGFEEDGKAQEGYMDFSGNWVYQYSSNVLKTAEATMENRIVKKATDGKYSIFDDKNMQVSSQSYDYIKSPQVYVDSEGCKQIIFCFENAGKWGLLNGDGSVILSPQYDSIYKFDAGLALAQSQDKYGFIDYTGKVIVPIENECADTYFENGVEIYYGTNGNAGLVDKEGNIILDSNKYIVDPPSEELVEIRNMVSKIGLMYRNGMMIFEPDYDEISVNYKNGNCIYSLHKAGDNSTKYCILYKGEKTVSFPKYDIIKEFNNKGYAIVKKGNKYGIVDSEFKEILPPIYASIYQGNFYDNNEVRDRYFYINLNPTAEYQGQQGLFDAQEAKMLINPQAGFRIQLGGSSMENVIAMTKGTQKALYFMAGNKLLSLAYDKFNGCENGIIFTDFKNKKVYYNMNGKKVFEFDDGYFFQENGLITVKKNGKWGAVNKNGTFIVKPISDYPLNFANGYAMIANGKKQGVVSEKGIVVINFQSKYQFYSDFNNGIVVIGTGNGMNIIMGLMDNKGKVLVQSKYHYIGNPGGKLILTYSLNTKRYKYIDKTGRVIIDKAEFQDAGDFSEGLARVKVKGQYGYIDETGKYVIKPTLNFSDLMATGNFVNGIAVFDPASTKGILKNGTVFLREI